MSNLNARQPSIPITPGVAVFNEQYVHQEVAAYLFKPFRAEEPGFFLVIQGVMTFQCNLQPVTCSKGCIYFVNQNSTYMFESVSEDCRFYGITFSFNFLLANNIHPSGAEIFQIMSGNDHKFDLTPEEYAAFERQFFQLDTQALHHPFPYLNATIIHYQVMALIFMAGSLFYNHNHLGDIKLDRRQELTARFLDLLRLQFKSERGLRYYADCLAVTTGYLAKVVKQVLDKQASELIDQAVVIEAKILLSNPSVTVAQVAEELKFSDQSFFGKYFKKHTGLSPSVYKQNSRKVKNNLF